MLITIKTQHFKKAKSYASPTSCPLAEALKDKFPHAYNIVVGPDSFKLNNEEYNFDLVDWGYKTIHNNKVTNVDELIDKAKFGLSTPQFVVRTYFKRKLYETYH